MTPKSRIEKAARARLQPVRTFNVPIFNAGGEPPQSRNVLSEPVPERLTLSIKREILKDLGLPPEPGSEHAFLSPSQPSVPNKGALVFVNANIVEGGEGFAFWNGGNPKGSVQLWIKSPKGRGYLVEFGAGRPKIEDEMPSIVIEVEGPDGITHEFNERNSWGTRGVFYFKATTNGWHGFTITGGTKIDPSTPWRFHDCLVTNV